jgi:transposase
LPSLCIELGFNFTKRVLKKFLRKLGYGYTRIRKRLKNKPNEDDYNKKLDEITDLIRLEKSKFIKMYFADEAGISQTPSVPYGWQDRKNPLSYPSSKGKRWNIFGIMSSDNELYANKTTKSITSAFVIESIDEFVRNNTRCPQSVILIDNAKIHTSDEFKSKIPQWKDQDVQIFYLPTYSPHLNRIETLWRKIRYEWLLPIDFDSWQAVTEKIQLIIDAFGKEYAIKFSDF